MLNKKEVKEKFAGEKMKIGKKLLSNLINYVKSLF